MDINIPNYPEKGNPIEELPKEPQSTGLKQVFVPVLIILVGLGGFGLGKLNKIEQSKLPIVIEHSTSTQKDTTPAVGTATPPNLGGAGGGTSTDPVTSTITKRRIYVASRTGTAYYLPSCASANRIAEKNKVWFETKQEAESAGYKPAANCKGM